MLLTKYAIGPVKLYGGYLHLPQPCPQPSSGDRKTTTAALEAYVPEAQPMLRKQIHYHCFV
jgi:hypothetical protein